MSFVIVNGYKIEVDDGIFVDGMRIDPKYSWQSVFDACKNSPRKEPDYVSEARAQERAEREKSPVDRPRST